ncbi:hypothetical protein B0H17DRAFT_1144335 [Mycena rosella]|uniref:DDE Tnp4 domain-containing protein n=1 Tax=Mycena rosella TaxID=1033263 RepID=A0AAD7CTA1_MYCRO|nr:hypothetical protein B0H17DRAFT_1144335 [Mycena rosella]
MSKDIIERPHNLATVLAIIENGAASVSETNILALAAAQLAISMMLPNHDPPRLEQGGEHITEQWLLAQKDRHCLWAFRLTADKLIRLSKALNIPERVKTTSGHVFSAIEALALLCTRFRSAGNIYELVLKYDPAQSTISEIINYLSCDLDDRWSHLLDFDYQGILSHENLVTYAEAIHVYSATIWGFLDCMIRQILFGHLYGPIEGRRNDNHLLVERSLLERCQEHATQPDIPGDALPEVWYLQLFGDPAYGATYQICSLFAGLGERTAEEKEWNHQISRPRMSVENRFGEVIAQWPFLNGFWK